jgi:hypothetical protein
LKNKYFSGEDRTSKSSSLKIMVALVAMAFGGWTACDKDDNPTSPPDTSNHAPVISSITAEPDTFVMESSTVITVTASDPDSDALTYNWELHGELQPVASESNTVRVMNCCPILEPTKATVLSIVSDGRGGEARDSVDVWMLPLPLK